MGWYGRIRDNLKDCLEILKVATPDTLAWIRAVDRWNDLSAQVDNLNWEDLNKEILLPNDLPFEYETYNRRDCPQIHLPKYDETQIIRRIEEDKV